MNFFRQQFTFIMLCIMSFFLFADQNLMAPNLTQIAEDFGFSAIERDTKLGGEISFVFWMLGGFVTLFIGYFTDKVNRIKLLTCIILIGEIPCLLTGFTQTYQQLFWMRALTGIGIGGAIPLIYSLLGDLFPAERRSAAAGTLGLITGLGMAGGQLLAGAIGPEMGWKLPFIIVAVPNFILVFFFWIFSEEPVRGGQDSGKTQISSGFDLKAYMVLFKIKTNLLVFLQGIFGTVPWSVFFTFLIDYLSQEKNYSVMDATFIVTIIGASAIFGGFIGGHIGNWLYNKKAAYVPVLCTISTTVGVIPTLFLLNMSPAAEGSGIGSIPIFYGILSGLCIAMTAPNIKAVLINVNAPQSRGSIFALYNLADDLGRGFGPVIISLLIVMFQRSLALSIAACFWLICGVFLVFMIWTYPKDQLSGHPSTS